MHHNFTIFIHELFAIKSKFPFLFEIESVWVELIWCMAHSTTIIIRLCSFSYGLICDACHWFIFKLNHKPFCCRYPTEPSSKSMKINANQRYSKALVVIIYKHTHTQYYPFELNPKQMNTYVNIFASRNWRVHVFYDTICLAGLDCKRQFRCTNLRKMRLNIYIYFYLL